MRFLPALAWAALIFFLSAQSELPEVMDAFVARDKLAHAAAYAVLTLLLLWGARFPRDRAAWGWVLLAVLYGALDEVHQRFVPLRHADVFDLLADALGAVTVGLARLQLEAVFAQAGRLLQRAQRSR